MSLRYYEDHAEYSVGQRKPYGSYNGLEERKPTPYRQKEEYQQVPTSVRQTESSNEEILYMNGWQATFEGLLRPFFAEFFAVFVTIFLTIHVDSELAERHIPGVQRISLVALVDAAAATLFYSSFKTVHLHPFLTVANLFTLTSSFSSCILAFIAQITSATLAILTISKTGSLPPLRKLDHDINTDAELAFYRLLLAQFLGTALVGVAYLMCHSSRRMGTRNIAVLSESPAGLFMAIFLCSFLSLLHSNQNWNPLTSFGVALVRIYGSETLSDCFSFLKFWGGPGMGALLASFLYRLVYAPYDRLLIHCCQPKETHIF